jgi:hypothetical protein
MVEGLRALRYPTRTPIQLAELICKLVSAIRDEILQQSLTVDPSDEDFERAVKFSVKVTHQLASHLRFVERAATQHTPWSLILPLEKIAERIHPGCRFIIRPQWNYNFTILEVISYYQQLATVFCRHTTFRNVLDDAGIGLVNSFYVIGFPLLDQLSILKHVLLGHEIGHPIEKEYFETHPDEENVLELEAEVEKALKKPDPGEELFWLHKKAKLLGNAQTICHRAIAELICDMVCLSLFGPAALFAFFEFPQTSDLDTIAHGPAKDHYPPWRYRLRALAELTSEAWFGRFLDAGGFEARVTRCLLAYIARIRNVAAIESDRDEIRKDPARRIAYTYVDRTLPQASKFVSERLSQRGFSMDNLIGKTNSRLLRQLEHWVPPDSYIDDAGKEVAADLFTILNIGWIRLVVDFPNVPESALNNVADQEEYLECVDALNRLILKAIENSMVRNAWKKNKP